jgi:hypothetical protein
MTDAWGCSSELMFWILISSSSGSGSELWSWRQRLSLKCQFPWMFWCSCKLDRILLNQPFILCKTLFIIHVVHKECVVSIFKLIKLLWHECVRFKHTVHLTVCHRCIYFVCRTFWSPEQLNACSVMWELMAPWASNH